MVDVVNVEEIRGEECSGRLFLDNSTMSLYLSDDLGALTSRGRGPNSTISSVEVCRGTNVSYGAISPRGDTCALVYNGSLSIHCFPNADQVKIPAVYRSPLEITFVDFDKSGDNM